MKKAGCNPNPLRSLHTTYTLPHTRSLSIQEPHLAFWIQENSARMSAIFAGLSPACFTLSSFFLIVHHAQRIAHRPGSPADYRYTRPIDKRRALRTARCREDNARPARTSQRSVARRQDGVDARTTTYCGPALSSIHGCRAWRKRRRNNRVPDTR